MDSTKCNGKVRVSDLNLQYSHSDRLADVCSRLHVDVAVTTSTATSSSSKSPSVGNGHEHGKNGKLKTKLGRPSVKLDERNHPSQNPFLWWVIFSNVLSEACHRSHI